MISCFQTLQHGEYGLVIASTRHSYTRDRSISHLSKSCAMKRTQQHAAGFAIRTFNPLSSLLNVSMIVSRLSSFIPSFKGVPPYIILHSNWCLSHSLLILNSVPHKGSPNDNLLALVVKRLEQFYEILQFRGCFDLVVIENLVDKVVVARIKELLIVVINSRDE